MKSFGDIHQMDLAFLAIDMFKTISLPVAIEELTVVANSQNHYADICSQWSVTMYWV
jgi:hypothetical protein